MKSGNADGAKGTQEGERLESATKDNHPRECLTKAKPAGEDGRVPANRTGVKERRSADSPCCKGSIDGIRLAMRWISVPPDYRCVNLLVSKDENTHRLESRMREIRLSGSEGGAAQFNAPSLPLSSLFFVRKQNWRFSG